MFKNYGAAMFEVYDKDPILRVIDCVFEHSLILKSFKLNLNTVK